MSLLSEAWFQNVPLLIERTEKLYKKQETAGKKGLVVSTAIRTLQERKWIPNKASIREGLEAAIVALKCFYVPEGMDPGPLFAFPMFDVDGIPRRAQTRPLHKRYAPGKYMFVGDFMSGPTWLGMSDDTLTSILEKRKVLLCEGPFDLLAIRTLEPVDRIPSISPLTKDIGWKHRDHLVMLGVDEVLVMMDNEKSKNGEVAMDNIVKALYPIQVTPLQCPGKDPSACLESVTKTLALRSLLKSIGDRLSNDTVTEFVIEEDD